MEITSHANLLEWIEVNRNDYCFRCYSDERELISTLGRSYRDSDGSTYLDHEFALFRDFALELIDSLKEWAVSIRKQLPNTKITGKTANRRYKKASMPQMTYSLFVGVLERLRAKLARS